MRSQFVAIGNWVHCTV